RRLRHLRQGRGADARTRVGCAPAGRSTMLKEFKQFAMRGNMIDLAIGVVLGAAFGAIIASLVKDIVTPPLGKLIGGVDFTDLFIVLGGDSYPSLKAAKDAGAATINYGLRSEEHTSELQSR